MPCRHIRCGPANDRSICIASPGYTRAPTAPLIGLYPIYNYQRQRRRSRNGCERETKGRLGESKKKKNQKSCTVEETDTFFSRIQSPGKVWPLSHILQFVRSLAINHIRSKPNTYFGQLSRAKSVSTFSAAGIQFSLLRCQPLEHSLSKRCKEKKARAF